MKLDSEKLYDRVLSERTMEKGEKVIITIAIVSFLLHLGIIALVDMGVFGEGPFNELLSSPISAIYTPFSFILFFEVYLLVYFLPRSITVYISKQYEIITLIVIRRLFKDLSQLELSSDWFEIKYDLQFTYDLIAALILFFLIFLFNKLNKKASQGKIIKQNLPPKLKVFIARKKILAAFLVPVFIIMAIVSLFQWSMISFITPEAAVGYMRDINEVFFDEFFTVLIMTDVLLLLLSLYHTNEFSRVFRNSGFIISTILIRLSFGTDGLLNTVLIVVAVLFGLAILAIHSRFEKIQKEDFSN
jgi:hypothetical protein